MPRKNVTRECIVYRSDEAKVDLIEIWLFIAQDNEAAADNTLQEIGEQMQLLAHSPKMGRERQEIRSGLFSFPVGKYIVFYTEKSDGIAIVRVLHSARDPRSQLW